MTHFDIFKTYLKSLNIPFNDPCDPNYTGDCSVCDTGTGTGGSPVSITSIVLNNIDGGDTTSLTVNWVDGAGTPQSTVSNIVLTLDNQDATQVVFDGSSCGITATTVADALCELTGGDAVQVNAGNVPATLIDPTTATPTENETVFQQYDNGVVISVYNGTTWINVPIIVSTENIPVETTDITLIDCTTLPLGQLVTIVGNGTSLDPDWVYRVTSDGAGGCQLVNIESPENHGNIAYVAKTGNDATAVIGNPHKPFSTIQAALDASASSSFQHEKVVEVLQGDYLPFINIPDGVNLVFREGVRQLRAVVIEGRTTFTNRGIVLVDAPSTFPCIIIPITNSAAQKDIRISGRLEQLGGGETIQSATSFVADGVTAITTDKYLLNTGTGTINVVVYNSYANVAGGTGTSGSIVYQVDSFTEDLNVV